MDGENKQIQLVTFQLGNELYGIDIMKVKEIQKITEVRAIPNVPSYVEGIFNLRGNIIPIINLHKRFQIRRAVMDESDELLSGFLIIELDGMYVGIFIDKIARVVTIDVDTIQPPPQMLAGIGTEYIRGVTKEDSGYLIILDVARLFDRKELQQLGKLSG